MNKDQQRYRNGRKLKLIKIMGGKCCKCGYNRNMAALDFHHLDPKIKEKNFSTKIRENWAEALEELKKCILVCRNCHMEIHFPHLSNFKMIEGECPVCKKAIYGTKFCSGICANVSRSKLQNKITKEILIEKISQKSFVAIGKEYGVSDVAVHKLAQRWGLSSLKKLKKLKINVKE